jgi:hypothetical protein
MSQTFITNPWGAEMVVADATATLADNFTYDEVLAIMFALKDRRDKLVAEVAETGIDIIADYPKFLTAIGEKLGKAIGEDF